MRRLGVVVVLSLVATLADAKVDRVLHEPVPENLYRAMPQEKSAAARAKLGTTTTASGQAGGPGSRTTPTPPSGQPAGAAPSGSEQFTIDRDTRRPDVLPYSDPFEPSVAPFKRLHAYDQLADSYVLSESGEPRREILVSPAVATEMVFNAKLTFTVESGVPVRLPTPGPGARLISAEASTDDPANAKPVDFIVRTDGAENWDFETAMSGPVIVKLRIAVAPDAFGGDFGDPTWEQLPLIVPLPRRAQTSAAQVTHAIGVSRALPVREAVRKLVAYFRSFQESSQPPPPSGDVYLDLALSKKGVCRHRAFAFFVTARSLGIPTRVITNEAHAWVEVHNGTRWKRIDLGGAGGALESSVKPPMTPPPDPFAWPESADRGSDLASRARETPSLGGGGGLGGSGAAAGGSDAAGGGAAAYAAANAPGAASNSATSTPRPEDLREQAVVEVYANEPNAKRGGMLPVRGAVRANGHACAHASVVISLREAQGRAPSIALGVVPAKSDGSFESSVFVPRDLPPGDYEILAQTPGDSRCSKSAD